MNINQQLYLFIFLFTTLTLTNYDQKNAHKITIIWELNLNLNALEVLLCLFHAPVESTANQLNSCSRHVKAGKLIDIILTLISTLLVIFSKSIWKCLHGI